MFGCFSTYSCELLRDKGVLKTLLRLIINLVSSGVVSGILSSKLGQENVN